MFVHINFACNQVSNTNNIHILCTTCKIFQFHFPFIFLLSRQRWSEREKDFLNNNFTKKQFSKSKWKINLNITLIYTNTNITHVNTLCWIKFCAIFVHRAVEEHKIGFYLHSKYKIHYFEVHFRQALGINFKSIDNT